MSNDIMGCADEYVTLRQGMVAEGFYSEKRSKFLAFALHVDSEEKAKEVLTSYRKRFFDARHVCYAYVVGLGDSAVSRANDDGEPSNSAGKPILGQIVKQELTNVIVIVVRYFGGVKLGTGGLMVAYRTAASDALEHAETERRIVEETVDYSFPYVMMNDVMRVIKEMKPRIVDQKFDNTCQISLAIRKSEAQRLRDRLANLAFSD